MRASIELLPDPSGEDLVRACWRALSAAGLPGRGDHQGLSNWPHVTVWESAVHVADRLGVPRAEAPTPGVVPVDRLRPVLDLLPVSAPVLGIAVLGRRDRGVVVLELDPTALAPVHDRVHEIADAGGAGWRRTPWRPHLSLTRALPAELVDPAVDVVGPIIANAPAVRLVRLRTWDPAVARAEEIACTWLPSRPEEWARTQSTGGWSEGVDRVDGC